MTDVDPSTASAVRRAARQMADNRPGKAIELRIPPYTAVQLGTSGPGPTHRRGTPPTVVEMDPETFLDLIAHILTWDEAVRTNRVSASGAHADLSDLFSPDEDLCHGVAASVEAAATIVNSFMSPTPLQPDPRLSDATGASVWLKREDLSPVRSYKLRGAYVLMHGLTDEQRAAGVVCASAGNHAQGVAFACAALSIDGLVVVPTTTPRQKRERIAALGGSHVRLVVAGETYDASSAIARQIAVDEHRTLVPAFNHLATVAGQGTVAREIVAQLGGRAPDVVVLPVGGGGLLAGCGSWLSQHCPQTTIVGVEPSGAACMAAALAAGHPVELEHVDTFVDGAAVGQAGDVTFPLVQAFAPTMLAVSEGQVCSEMLALYQSDGVIAEPAGALASSVLKGGPHDVTLTVTPGQTVVCVLSGGNNDISRYSEVIERSLVHEGRKHYLLVTFPQEPGSLRRFLNEVLGPDDDIVLFEYTKKSNREMGPALVGIELGNPDDYPALLARLAESPLTAEIVDPTSTLYRYLV